MSPKLFRPVLVKRRRKLPKPVFNEKMYGRTALKRLTPLTWFLVVVGVFVVIGAVILAANRISDNSYRSMLLSERLGITVTVNPNGGVAQAAPVNTLTPDELALGNPIEPTVEVSTAMTSTVVAGVAQRKPQTPKSGIQSSPTDAPTETPAPQATAGGPLHVLLPTAVFAHAEPVSGPTPAGGAPWAAQLVRQPDGTLLAPPEVLEKAAIDLSGYYTETHAMLLADYLAKRDKLLPKYFTGEALKGMLDLEAKRTQYEMNTNGTVAILVRNFTLDGYTAKAGIYLRSWLTNDYDVSTKALLREKVAHTDSLIVMTVTYDKATSHWVYAKVADIGELKP